MEYYKDFIFQIHDGTKIAFSIDMGNLGNDCRIGNRNHNRRLRPKKAVDYPQTKLFYKSPGGMERAIKLSVQKTRGYKFVDWWIHGRDDDTVDIENRDSLIHNFK